MSMILRSSKIVSLLMILILVSGCSWFGGKKDSGQDRRDSQSLEVPPELTQPQTSDAMAIPVVTAEQARYGTRPAEQQTAVVDTDLLPRPVGARVVQIGDLRWAELEGRPETIWQEIQGFFRSIGFEISYEDAQLGVLETNWLSNRVYRNIGLWKSLFGGETVVGLKDRYRVRLERSDDSDITKMFLAHQGLMEDVDEEYAGATIFRYWRWRPNDPDLEAEVLQRFLVFRGMDEKQAVQVSKPKPRVERAVLQDVSNGQIVVVNDNFARTWRRVGVAIDRLGLIVTDRNRSDGIYYLQLSDDFVEQHTAEGSGLMTKWFGDDDDKKSTTAYVMKLEERGETTTVSLHDQNGQLDNSATAKKLNKLLYQQLH